MGKPAHAALRTELKATPAATLSTCFSLLVTLLIACVKLTRGVFFLLEKLSVFSARSQNTKTN